MKARMEKYTVDPTVKSRTSKNESLYSEVGNMNIDYVDIDVDNAVELNPTPSGRSSREDYQKQRELNKILPNAKEHNYDDNSYVEPKEDRVYDINEILSMARKNKLFEDEEKKRLINTEYNILTKLDVAKLDNEDMKKEDLKTLINDIYDKEAPKKEKKYKKYSRSEEAKLLNDLFDDDEPEEKEIKLVEESSQDILDKEEDEQATTNQEEITKELKINEEPEEVVATQIITPPEGTITNIDANKELAPETDTTTMYDFGINKKSKKKKEKGKTVNMLADIDLEKVKKEGQKVEEEYEESEGKGLVVAIIIVVILILLACGFFVYEYFFGL